MITTERAEQPGAVPESDTILSVRDLRQEFGDGGLPWRKTSRIRAVDGVSFDIRAGEVFGLVGESGSGKSTIGRITVRLQEPTSGAVFFRGHDIRSLKGKDLLTYRRQVQMVFQNPLASLNPRRRIGDQIGDPIVIQGLESGAGIRRRVEELATLVGLAPDMMDRYPHELSSGQRQRVGIARSLAASPTLLVADEPVSALDVSVQAQVINLLRSLQRELHLTLLFISHDLRVVRFLCDRIAVLYLGRVMELGDRDDITQRPMHPYTKALVASMPKAGSRSDATRIISGDISQEIPDPAGCVFAPRCSLRVALGNPSNCTTERPSLRQDVGRQLVACHHADKAAPEGRDDAAGHQEHVVSDGL